LCSNIKSSEIAAKIVMEMEQQERIETYAPLENKKEEPQPQPIEEPPQPVTYLDSIDVRASQPVTYLDSLDAIHAKGVDWQIPFYQLELGPVLGKGKHKHC
jgi:hypothetical protein